MVSAFEVSLEREPHDTPFTIGVPARALSSKGRIELEEALEAVKGERRTLGDYQAESAALNAQSSTSPSNIRLIRDLNRANAKVVAAASRGISTFPDEVSVVAG